MLLNMDPCYNFSIIPIQPLLLLSSYIRFLHVAHD